MDNLEFYDLFDELYACHGKAFTSRASKALWRRMAGSPMPWEFFQWAVGKLMDAPVLPQNMAYHLRYAMWPDYLEANPALKASVQREACPQCSPDTPGWILGWKGRRRAAFRCCCNSDHRFAHLRSHMRKHVLADGYEMDAPGMDYWREQVRNWREGKPYQKPRGMRGIVGRREEPERPDHARELQEAGNW